jgi:hypothetical protein
MTEPISVVLGTIGLTEGVKFLYAQAGELLKRWRERRDKVAAAGGALPATDPITLALPPAVFEGQLTAPQVHHDELAALQPRLTKLVGRLAVYQLDPGAIQAGDENLVKTLDDLRQVLETVYQQPLRFKGESPRVNPFVTGKVQVARSIGTVIAVDVGTVQGGATVQGTAIVENSAGDVVGVRAGTVGSSEP